LPPSAAGRRVTMACRSGWKWGEGRLNGVRLIGEAVTSERWDDWITLAMIAINPRISYRARTLK
jgi:hypothetical protein